MARAQKRLTKKELRQDPLIETAGKAKSFMDVHGRIVTISVAAVVALLVVAIVVSNIREVANDDALTSLAHVRKIVNQGRMEVAVDSLTVIADRYSGTQGGAEAVAQLAELHLSEGDSEAALEAFERLEREYKDSYLLLEAALSGQAAALENLGRFEEAAQRFEQLYRKNKFGHAKPYALFESGRLWVLAGNPDEAKRSFQRLLDNYEETPFDRDAELQLAQLNHQG